MSKEWFCLDDYERRDGETIDDFYKRCKDRFNKTRKEIEK